MRFMVLVKANKDSEAGVLPDNKILTDNWPVVAKPEGGGLGAMAFLKGKPGKKRPGASSRSEERVN